MNSNIKASIVLRFVAGCLFVVLVYYLQQHGLQQHAVCSAFIGVLACFIPEAYQAWKISKSEKEYEPNAWLRLAYQSMISKWLMTAMIFAISFSSSVAWDYKILFAGYIFVNISGVLTAILIKGKNNNVR